MQSADSRREEEPLDGTTLGFLNWGTQRSATRTTTSDDPLGPIKRTKQGPRTRQCEATELTDPQDVDWSTGTRPSSNGRWALSGRCADRIDLGVGPGITGIVDLVRASIVRHCIRIRNGRAVRIRAYGSIAH